MKAASLFSRLDIDPRDSPLDAGAKAEADAIREAIRTVFMVV
jgi:hypothetical protein